MELAVIHYKYRQKEPYMSLDSFRKIRQSSPPLSIIKFKIKLYSLQYSLVWWGFIATFLTCTWYIWCPHYHVFHPWYNLCCSHSQALLCPSDKMKLFTVLMHKNQLMVSSGDPFHPASPVNFIKDSEYPQTSKWGKGTSVIGNIMS